MPADTWTGPPIETARYGLPRQYFCRPAVPRIDAPCSGGRSTPRRATWAEFSSLDGSTTPQRRCFSPTRRSASTGKTMRWSATRSFQPCTTQAPATRCGWLLTHPTHYAPVPCSWRARRLTSRTGARETIDGAITAAPSSIRSTTSASGRSRSTRRLTTIGAPGGARYPSGRRRLRAPRQP